ncbi:MAG TPA: hypothetical protein H9964_04895, partial [Candidatus Gallimonas intestinavium]|nr:hypothetical protein [Candidatus Gallimonas intestinavium]
LFPQIFCYRKIFAGALLFTPSVCCADTVSAAQGRRRLGLETARSMRRFQVRKWSKPHRGFAKNALAHPSKREPRDTMKLIATQEMQAKQGARGFALFFDDKVHRLGNSRG